MDLRTQSKSVDWRNAVRTFPARTGTDAGSQCVVGELFLRPDAESGQALYYCDAQEQWQVVGGSSTGAAGLWQAGPGIGIVDLTLAVDDAVVPQYVVGSGAAAGPCTPGRDLYVDIALGRFYYCGQTDTWKTIADLTGVARVTESNTFAAGQKQTFTPSATTAGLNIGTLSGDPSVPADGDLWYNSSTRKFRARQAGANVDLAGASGSSGGLQKPSVRRFALFQYIGSGTALTGIGDNLSPQGTGTASLPASDSDESALNLLSAATSDSRAEELGTLMWRTGRNLRMEAKVRMMEFTGQRTFIGTTDKNGGEATSSPITTGRYVGFRYDSASDATWKCYHDNSTGTPGTADSGVAVDSLFHLFTVAYDDTAALVRMYIDGALVCTLSSNYPGATGTNYNLRMMVSERTTEAVAKNLRVAYLYMEGDR